MARKTTRTTVIREEAGGTTGEELTLPGEHVVTADNAVPDKLDVIEELQNLVGDDVVKYSVFRIPRKPGELGGYCSMYNKGELSGDSIRETWGGGRYSIRAIGSDGKYLKVVQADILDAPKSATPAAAASDAVTVRDLIALFAGMQRPSGDSEALKAMLASQSEMIKGLMSRPEPKGPSITDILAIMKAGEAKGDGPVEMLLRGITLGKELGGEGGGEGDWLSLAGKGLDALKPILANLPSRAATPIPPQIIGPPATLPPGAPPAAAAPPPGNGAAPQPKPQARVANPMLRQLNWLNAQVKVLLYQAVKAGNPALYAALIAENLPPFITAADLRARLDQPDAIKQLAQLDARVLQHAEWFEQFRLAMLTRLAPQPAAPPAPADPPPDVSDDPGGDLNL